MLYYTTSGKIRSDVQARGYVRKQPHLALCKNILLNP